MKSPPQKQDFARKYKEEGQSKLYGRLIDNYFKAVADLFSQTRFSSGTDAAAVELGCGEGFSTARLRQLLPASIQLQASEYVAEQVFEAQKRNPGVKIIQESVYETTYADDSFDLVFLFEVLEHLDEPQRALRELARILKPEGYLILGVPREPIWCALNMARGKYLAHFGNTPGHLNHWSSLGLRRYIDRHFGPVLSHRMPLPWTQVLARKRT